MKKAYTKPEIIFDDFSLANTIAAGCAVRYDLQSRTSCGIQYAPGIMVFIEEPACNTTKPDGWNGYCYHNPTDLTNLFNSL